MNINELFTFIRQASNPQQAVMNMMQEKANSNPIFANIYQLAQQGKTQEIESIAKNLCQEKGLDFNKEFNSFRQTLGF